MLERNITLNATCITASGGSATAFPLIWGETDCKLLDEEWQKADFVLAADVVYHRELMTPLLDTVKALGKISSFHMVLRLFKECFQIQAHFIAKFQCMITLV